MFKFNLTQDFRKRPDDEIPPFPRGAVQAARAALDNTKIGAYAALGAVMLGAAMLTANLARHTDAPTAQEMAATPAKPEPAKITVAPLPAPSSVAVVAPATPAPATPEKMTVRVDTSSTGAIAQEKPAKPKHKPHAKKPKPVDNSE